MWIKVSDDQMVNIDNVKWIKQGKSCNQYCIKIVYVDNSETTIWYLKEKDCNESFEKIYEAI